MGQAIARWSDMRRNGEVVVVGVGVGVGGLQRKEGMKVNAGFSVFSIGLYSWSMTNQVRKEERRKKGGE